MRIDTLKTPGKIWRHAWERHFVYPINQTLPGIYTFYLRPDKQPPTVVIPRYTETSAGNQASAVNLPIRTPYTDENLSQDGIAPNALRKHLTTNTVTQASREARATVKPEWSQRVQSKWASSRAATAAASGSWHTGAQTCASN